MKKCYLAGPMRGLPDENIHAFAYWKKRLEDRGYEVFSPPDHCPPGTPIKECMMKDIAWICTEADFIAMMPGWENSKGANTEHQLAVTIDLPIEYLGGVRFE